MSAKESIFINKLPLKTIKTNDLHIAYFAAGDDNGWPVILSHGFPYDVHAYEEVTTILVKEGARVIIPYTRGFGATRFISEDIMRNGQQAARGSDLMEMSDAIGLNRPILAGFDWGGNASCVVAALWPEKVGGLVSYAGYDIIDIEQQKRAFAPSLERVCWYQHLFKSERGRECLAESRYELGKILWQEWSPGWEFDEDIYARTAHAFENPDFVDVVIHTYRFMHGLEDGTPALQSLEGTLAQKPTIKVPTVTIDGANDPLKPGGSSNLDALFTGTHEHITVQTGHNVPLEAPQFFADAILKVHGWLS